MKKFNLLALSIGLILGGMNNAAFADDTRPAKTSEPIEVISEDDEFDILLKEMQGRLKQMKEKNEREAKELETAEKKAKEKTKVTKNKKKGGKTDEEETVIPPKPKFPDYTRYGYYLNKECYRITKPQGQVVEIKPHEYGCFTGGYIANISDTDDVYINARRYLYSPDNNYKQVRMPSQFMHSLDHAKIVYNDSDKPLYVLGTGILTLVTDKEIPHSHPLQYYKDGRNGFEYDQLEGDALKNLKPGQLKRFGYYIPQKIEEFEEELKKLIKENPDINNEGWITKFRAISENFDRNFAAGFSLTNWNNFFPVNDDQWESDNTHQRYDVNDARHPWGKIDTEKKEAAFERFKRNYKDLYNIEFIDDDMNGYTEERLHNY